MFNVTSKGPRSVKWKYSEQKHYVCFENGGNFKVVAGPFVLKTFFFFFNESLVNLAKFIEHKANYLIYLII